MGKAENGKGDRRRKQDLEKYGKNFVEIFKKFDFAKAVDSIKKKRKNKKDQVGIHIKYVYNEDMEKDFHLTEPFCQI